MWRTVPLHLTTPTAQAKTWMVLLHPASPVPHQSTLRMALIRMRTALTRTRMAPIQPVPPAAQMRWTTLLHPASTTAQTKQSAPLLAVPPLPPWLAASNFCCLCSRLYAFYTWYSDHQSPLCFEGRQSCKILQRLNRVFLKCYKWNVDVVQLVTNSFLLNIIFQI